jgi:hypothetical protein
MKAPDPSRGSARLSANRSASSGSASVLWLRLARKIAVAVIGSSVLTFGVALIVLPGPAVLVIPFGLAILATEFIWARKLLDRSRKLLRRRSRQPRLKAGK